MNGITLHKIGNYITLCFVRGELYHKMFKIIFFISAIIKEADKVCLLNWDLL